MKNFWPELKKPIFALAPMAGVTDSAFRQICKTFGADVVYSEMASAAALVYQPAKTLAMLKFSPKERPYVVQFFGSQPEHFSQAVKLVEKKIKPDGFDINFGCPVKKVAKQGAGAVLMNDLKLARRIIKAVLAKTDLPVSVKCRSRVGQVTVLDFLKTIKDLPVAAIMIHGRSLAQGHSGSVDWKIIKQARKCFSGVILANGGVGTLEHPLLVSPLVRGRNSGGRERGARDYVEWLLEKTGADGVGIGQGALGRPWIFEELRITNYPLRRSFPPRLGEAGSEASECRIKNARGKSVEDIFKIMIKHAELAQKLKGERGILEMRKHLCWYVRGLENASELRRELVKVESLEGIKKIFSCHCGGAPRTRGDAAI